MRCSKCKHDLLVGVEPEGFGKVLKLLPITPYSCLRCGANNWRISEAYDSTWARLFLVVLLAGAVASGVWFYQHTTNAQKHANSIRRDIKETTPAPAASSDQHLPSEPADPAAQPNGPEYDGAPTQPQQAMKQPETAPDDMESAQASLSAEQAEANESTPAAEASPENAPLPIEEATASKPTAAPQPKPAEEPIQSAPKAKPANQKAQAKVAAKPEPAPRKAKPQGKATTGASSLGVVTASVWNGKTVVKAQLTGKLGRREAFTLKAPLRYVVDLYGKWTLGNGKKQPLTAGKAKAARVGVYKNKLRLVVDLNAAPSATPTIRTEKGYLIITIP